MSIRDIANLIIHFLTVYILGFYLITVLQWYNYKINRIIFHFHNYKWHIFYFIIPVLTYIFAYKFFWIYLFFGLIPALFIWFKKINKTLKPTKRVKRFFLILGLSETLNLAVMNKLHYNPGIAAFGVIVIALFISMIIENIMFLKYKSVAKEKLKRINPIIITITGSYGKTSIKNFLYQLLKNDFKVYKTPRSVNTIKGIVLDINTSLPENTEIYITEAGAREKGDIKEIVTFLENNYSILGEIGPQHIEYFKTLENIQKTKLEIFETPKLLKGFSYEKIDNKKVISLKNKIINIRSNLSGTEWDIKINNKIHHFKTSLLGEFNSVNVTLAIYCALEFIKNIEKIKLKVLKLKSVPHRLQKIEAGGKIIIDDSFNGNVEGMLKSFDLISTYSGRKVIVTPGLVEANNELNKKIAQKIDEIFDLAIITGNINKDILCKNISNTNKVYVADKSKLEKILADLTKSGDLIIFSNDAPEYL